MPPRRSDDDTITKDDLPDDVVEYIEALEDALDVYKAADEVEDDEVDDDTDDGDDDTDDDTDDDGDEDEDDEDDEDEARKALAKADPAVRSYIEKAEQRAIRAEALAKAERDERLRRDFVAKAQTMPMIGENADALGGLMKSLHDLDPKVADQVERIFKAANEAIAQGNIFSEMGAPGTETVSASLDSAAKGIQKADPTLTYEQAVAKALEANPALYDEHLNG